LKGAGYIISIVSVLLLGIVAWSAVASEPLLRLCLIGGMATSVVGMALRYAAHRRDRRELKRLS
jgi:uncharacterized protein involved in response to NO